MTKTLEQILNLYGSDKSTKHYYHTIYEPYFEKIRYDKINILEVGILDGKSMLAWLEYFPNAEIYGIEDDLVSQIFDFMIRDFSTSTTPV